MLKHCNRLALLAVFGGACAVMAGFYINDSRYVGRLSIHGRMVSEHKGQASLGAEPALSPWKVHISTLQTGTGKFLAYSAAGKDASVVYVDKESVDTHWTIHIVNSIKPKEARGFGGRSDGPLYEGKQGIEFKLSARNGPFAGWYLAESPGGPAEMKVTTLMLVKEPKQAAILTFEERFHRPIDKKSKK